MEKKVCFLVSTCPSISLSLSGGRQGGGTPGLSSDLLLRFSDGAFRVIFVGTESTNSLEVKDPSLISVHHPVILSLSADLQTEIEADFISRCAHTSERICSSLGALDKI